MSAVHSRTALRANEDVFVAHAAANKVFPMTGKIEHMRYAWSLYLLLLALKIFLASRLPIINDEAYYIQWGDHTSWSYYDHPPLVGWIANLINQFVSGDGHVTLRLLAYRSVPIIGMFVLAWLVSRAATQDRRKRHLVALLYLYLPESFASIIFSTDFFALFFSTCGGLLWWKSIETRRLGMAFAAGLTFSIGFLAKETQCFALVGIGLWWLLHLGSRFAWKNFFVVQVGFWPLVTYWFWEIVHHCGGPMLLHFGRVDWQSRVKWLDPLQFFIQDLLQEAALIGPWTIWALAMYWRRLKTQSEGSLTKEFARPEKASALGWLIAGNWVCFAVLALKQAISLHWGVLFHPFVIVLAGDWLSRIQLLRLLHIQFKVAAGLCLFLGIVVCAPLNWFRVLGDGYKYAVFMKEQSLICPTFAAYKQQNPTLHFASPNYGHGASVQFTCSQPFSVINSRTQYGRSDDLWTDWRDLHGSDILVFSVDKIQEQDYAPFFSKVTLRLLPSSDPAVSYYLIYGERFRWEDYRQAELLPLKEKFYSRPLLHTEKYCPFIRNYFPVPFGRPW